MQRILIDVMGFRGVGITVDSTVANLPTAALIGTVDAELKTIMLH